MLLLVLVVVGIYVPVFALLPSLSYTPQSLPSAIPQDEKVSMIHTSVLSTNCFVLVGTEINVNVLNFQF